MYVMCVTVPEFSCSMYLVCIPLVELLHKINKLIYTHVVGIYIIIMNVCGFFILFSCFTYPGTCIKSRSILSLCIFAPSNAQILRGNDVKTQSTIAMPSSVYEKTINQFGRRQYLILIYIIVHPLLSSSSNDHMRAVVSIDTVMKCFPSNVVHTEFT